MANRDQNTNYEKHDRFQEFKRRKECRNKKNLTVACNTRVSQFKNSTCYCLCVSCCSCSTAVNIWCHIVDFLAVFIANNRPFSGSSICPKNNSILRIRMRIQDDKLLIRKKRKLYMKTNQTKKTPLADTMRL